MPEETIIMIADKLAIKKSLAKKAISKMDFWISEKYGWSNITRPQLFKEARLWLKIVKAKKGGR